MAKVVGGYGACQVSTRNRLYVMLLCDSGARRKRSLSQPYHDQLSSWPLSFFPRRFSQYLQSLSEETSCTYTRTTSALSALCRRMERILHHSLGVDLIHLLQHGTCSWLEEGNKSCNHHVNTLAGHSGRSLSVLASAQVRSFELPYSHSTMPFPRRGTRFLVATV